MSYIIFLINVTLFEMTAALLPHCLRILSMIKRFLFQKCGMFSWGLNILLMDSLVSTVS